MKPTTLIATWAMAVSVARPALAQSRNAAPRNDLPQPYRTTRDWGQLPAGTAKWAAVTAVEAAPDGSIYVIHRCAANSCVGRPEPPILKFDQNGKLLKSWGAGMFNFPHGAAVDRRGNLWITDARGGGGNTTVFVAGTGVVLVDTKYPGFGETILDQVRSVTNKPVTTIVNTHTHNDHTGSNTEFPQTVEFVVQENTRANMARMDNFKGDKEAFLPTRTFKDRLSLLGGKDRIDLYYFGRGHTDGDTVLHFPALRVAVMGDLFARKWAPLVDTMYGGSMVAFPQTLAKAAQTLKDVDTIITGHATTTHGPGPGTTFTRSSPTMKPADLQEYAEFTRAFVAAAEAAMKAGKSVDAAAGSLNLPATFKDYDMANAKADVQRVYDELGARK